MTDAASQARGVLWTIGHSNHPLTTFLDLLRRHEIEVLVDVRSSPYSGYCPHFNIEQLGPAVKAAAMQYLYLGDSVGGRAEGPSSTTRMGVCSTIKWPPPPRFSTASNGCCADCARIAWRSSAAKKIRPSCHRRLLVGRVLAERGVELMHIRGDGRVQSETELAADEKFRKTKGQLSLFETEDPSRVEIHTIGFTKKSAAEFFEASAGPESDD